MKSKYFSSRYQTSQIRGTREKNVPKQTNWDRTVYLILLLSLLLFIGYYLTKNTFYIVGDGRVVTEEIFIRSPGDIHIDQFFTSASARVARGDTLFSFNFLNWELESEARADAVDQIERINLDIDSVSDQITLKEQEITVAQERIDYLEDLQQSFRDRVRLDVATHLELTEVSTNLFNAHAQLQIHQGELSVLMDSRNRHIARVQIVEQQLQEILEGRGSEFFVSPASGTTQGIYIGENQQAFRTDEILSMITSDADIYILSFFKRKDVKYLIPGTLMDVRFDNGEESTGIIRRTYDPRESIVNPINQFAELQNDYVVVELIPSGEQIRRQWLVQNRSGAEVYKSHFSRSDADNEPDNRSVSERQPESVHQLEPENAPASVSRTEAVHATDAHPESLLSGSESTNAELNQPSGSTEIANHQPQEKSEVESGHDTDGNADVTALHQAPGTSGNEQTARQALNVAKDVDRQSPEYGVYGEEHYPDLAGYSIITASLEKEEIAAETARRLKEIGYRVAVVPAVVDGRQYYRIAVGQFETERSALEAAAAIPANVAPDHYIRRMK